MDNPAGKLEIVTTTLQKLALKESLTLLGQKLNRATSNNFVVGRRELLNRSYIQVVISDRQSGSNYNYSVQMDNGKKIKISEAVYSKMRSFLPSPSSSVF